MLCLEYCAVLNMTAPSIDQSSDIQNIGACVFDDWFRPDALTSVGRLCKTLKTLYCMVKNNETNNWNKSLSFLHLLSVWLSDYSKLTIWCINWRKPSIQSQSGNITELLRYIPSIELYLDIDPIEIHWNHKFQQYRMIIIIL